MKILMGLEFDIILHKQLTGLPRFDMLTGCVSGGEVSNDSERFLGSKHVQGNSSNFFDTLSFDLSSKLLSGIELYTHLGVNDTETNLPSYWHDTSIILGLPRLIADAVFPVKIGNIFCCSSNGKTLAVFRPSALYPTANMIRLQIMTHTYLLISDGCLVGWMLVNPANYLTNDKNQDSESTQNTNIHKLFAKTFELTSGDNLDMMINRDFSMYEKLNTFKRELNSSDDDLEKRSAMIKYLDEFLNNYYE